MVVIVGYDRWSLRKDTNYRAMTGKIYCFDEAVA